jgi:hypothetical protein
MLAWILSSVILLEGHLEASPEGCIHSSPAQPTWLMKNAMPNTIGIVSDEHDDIFVGMVHTVKRSSLLKCEHLLQNKTERYDYRTSDLYENPVLSTIPSRT